MANVITQFLIGLGLDSKDLDKGLQDTDNKLRSFGAGAATTFAAVGAAGVTAFKWTSGKANEIDQINSAVQRYNTTIQDVAGYDLTLGKITGGDETGTMVAHLKELAQLQANVQRGQDNYNRYVTAGFDVTGWQGMNPQQLFNDMARQFQQQQNPTKQTAMAQELGLSDAEVRVLKQYGATIQEVSRATAEQAGITAELSENSVKLNAAVGELNANFLGLTNTVATKAMPAMSEFTGSLNAITKTINEWARNNPEIVTAAVSGTHAGLDKAAEVYLPEWAQQTAKDVAGSVFPSPVKWWGNIQGGWDTMKQWWNDNDVSPISNAKAGGMNMPNIPGGMDAVNNYNRSDNSITNNYNLRDVSAWNEPYNIMPEPVQQQGIADAINRAGDNWLASLRSEPMQFKGNVTVNSTLEMDGRVIAEKVDDRLDFHAEQALDQIRGSSNGY